MKNMNIYLNTPEDAINFVSTVSKVPYEADLSYGHCMVCLLYTSPSPRDA